MDISINPAVVFTIPFLGGIPVTITVVVEWIIMFILIISSALLTRGWNVIPTGVQNVIEFSIEGFNNFVKDALGDHWKTYAPYLGSVGLFLIVANTISIFGLTPPTKDLSATAALALMSIATVIIASIREKGFIGYIKSFFESPIGFFVKMLDLFTRPLSLAARLFGNIFAAVTIMELIASVAPIVIPAVFSIYFDLFDGLLQMLVFVFLTMLYIEEALEE